MVVSDHGQIDAGGHGGPEQIVLLEPFIVAGAGIRPGQYGDIQMVDVAPTAAVLLGTNLPASAQGRPLSEMLTLDDEQQQSLHLAFEAQQAGLLSAYTAAIGQPSQSISQDLMNLAGINAAYQTALVDAQSARLKTERMLRAAIALPVVLMMLYLLWRVPRAKLWWLLVSAMIYVLLFNLRYVVLDGRTYSLSSIDSANGMILYSGVTASLSFLLAWFVSSFGLGHLRTGNFTQSAQLAIQQALIISAVLAVPVVWSFVANGPMISWILPDFNSSFAGLLSLIQILFVNLSAILLGGVTALYEMVANRKPRLLASVRRPG